MENYLSDVIKLEFRKTSFQREASIIMRKINNPQLLIANLMDVLISLCSYAELYFKGKGQGAIKKQNVLAVVSQIANKDASVNMDMVSNIVDFIISHKLLITVSIFTKIWRRMPKYFRESSGNQNEEGNKN